MAAKSEKKYPARCIDCKRAFEVPREHSAHFGRVQTKYSCSDCSENKRGTKEIEKAKIEKETAQFRLEEEKEKTKQQELAVKKLELELQKAGLVRKELDEKKAHEQQEFELKKEQERTKQRELDEKKAHWEQMRAEIQSKENADQLKVQVNLAEAQKKQAESAQQALEEFKKLKEDGVRVTGHDLNSLLYNIPQPRVNEQEHIPRHRHKTWTAPIKTLPKLDETM